MNAVCSNPLAGTDTTLLALSGTGYMGGKLFGFASCERAVGAAEGMNVLAERRVPVSKGALPSPVACSCRLQHLAGISCCTRGRPLFHRNCCDSTLFLVRCDRGTVMCQVPCQQLSDGNDQRTDTATPGAKCDR